MLLAARALTFLADVYPPAAAAVIRHGAVPAFCARLLTIEYIDLAEQSLQVRLMSEWGGAGRVFVWGAGRGLLTVEYIDRPGGAEPAGGRWALVV